MSEHRVGLEWRNPGGEFSYDHFSRDHRLSLKDGRLLLKGSAAPEYLGSADAMDPEDALVAALASCHMLTFLAVSARKRLLVLDYRDDAVGVLEPDASGRLAVTRVTLRPVVSFGGANIPTSADLASLHAKAHANCFIANSVKTAVTVVPGGSGA